MAGRPKKYQTEEERIAARRIQQSVLRNLKREQLRDYKKQWDVINIEKLKENRKIYNTKNRESLRIKNKVWRDNNKEKILLYRKNYNSKQLRKINPILRFKNNVRALIYHSFKRSRVKYYKSLKSEIILGCTIEEFKLYILSKSPPNTSLAEFGQYGYHIDHIIPISSANTEEEIIKLCHYTNLQPLWWLDNIKKSNLIE
jgi:hypothetical protein